jgi:hypothetical protein
MYTLIRSRDPWLQSPRWQAYLGYGSRRQGTLITSYGASSDCAPRDKF